MHPKTAAGIVYAAGYLCQHHAEEELAAQLLASADMNTPSHCGDADAYDLQAAAPAFMLLRDRSEAHR